MIPKHERTIQAKPRAWMPPDNEGQPSFMVYAEPGEDYIPLFELSGGIHARGVAWMVRSCLGITGAALRKPFTQSSSGSIL